MYTTDSIIDNKNNNHEEYISIINRKNSLSPLDGRYRNEIYELNKYFSEYSLNEKRIFVEIEWILYLIHSIRIIKIKNINKYKKKKIRDIFYSNNKKNIIKLFEIEKQILHDVKSVEYFISDLLKKNGLQLLCPLIHFGCTSEDINNIAYALNIKNALHNVWIPKANQLLTLLSKIVEKEKNTPMLARTHGQPATPTTLGKEFAIILLRLKNQIIKIQKIDFLCKFNGASGNYATYYLAFPNFNWEKLIKKFIENFGLKYNPLTTQIEPNDWLSELFSNIARFNTILHGFCLDMWLYMSMQYFYEYDLIPESVGSSTMPHKINPIYFENAEANLELSTCLLNKLGMKLINSRLQRDLSDSALKRNIGLGFGYSLLSIKNIIKGLLKVKINKNRMLKDLNNHPLILSEAIQIILKTDAILKNKDIGNPYEKVKSFTRGKAISLKDIHKFIASLDISCELKNRILSLKPENYIGIASKLTFHALQSVKN